MSDFWELDDGVPHDDRPPSRPDQPGIEIPLTGGGPLTPRGGAQTAPDDRPDPTNWRRVVGLASLAGVVAGVVVAVVVLNTGQSDEPGGGIGGGPSTTLDGFQLATSITTPPTLPGPDQGAATVPATVPGTASGQPANTLASQPETTEPVSEVSATTGSLPDYPQFTGVPTGGLDSFDLEASVARLDDDVPRRSETHIEVGPKQATLDVTIVRDPFNNRYRLWLVSEAGVREAIVDIDSGLSYLPDDGNWVAIPNSGLVIGVGADEVAGYIERLMLGPLRPDTWAAATVEPGSLVFFPGTDAIARRFQVQLPGDLIPEWQFHDLSVNATLPSELRPERMTYLAYVDDQGELSRVLGEAPIDGADQLITHQITRLSEPEIVLLPDPALIRPAVDLTG